MDGVDVAEVAETVVFSIVKLFPPAFKPSIVRLSAPTRSIRGKPAVAAPDIVRAAPPAGDIVIDVYDADPTPLAFSNTDGAATTVGSVVSAQTSIVIVPV